MTLLGGPRDDVWRAERRDALRALLMQPVLSSRGESAREYRLVRTHENELRGWLERETGWRLTVDGAAARLHKRVEGADPTRGLRDGKRPFSRRRYVLFALALVVLERAGAQTTLGRLADGIVGQLGEPPMSAVALEFTLTGKSERADMVAVVRQLLAVGALRRVEGDEQRYVDAGQDVLYDIEHAILASLLQTAQPPSLVDASTFEGRLASVVEQPRDESDDARNRSMRHRLTRRLLDDPVVTVDSLDAEAIAYLTSQRRAITDRIRTETGLVAEIRAEGIAMLDPDARLTDVRMPEGGAPGHLALLIATTLGDAGRMTRADLVAHVGRLVEQHVGVWGKNIRERPAEDLLDEALSRLRALALLDIVGDDVIARPVLSRFRVGEPRMEGSARG